MNFRMWKGQPSAEKADEYAQNASRRFFPKLMLRAIRMSIPANVMYVTEQNLRPEGTSGLGRQVHLASVIR